MARASIIEARSAEIKQNYPRLVGKEKDIATMMKELDTLAKAAGVQVNTIRPAATAGGTPIRFEMTLKASWLQMAKFIQTAEAREQSFTFSDLNLVRQEISGELDATVTVERICITDSGKS